MVWGEKDGKNIFNSVVLMIILKYLKIKIVYLLCYFCVSLNMKIFRKVFFFFKVLPA